VKAKKAAPDCKIPTLNPAPFKAWQWRDGAFAACDSVPLSDRGFRYGMSVFESLRVTRGMPEFFEPHLARLIQACADREFAVEERALRATSALLQNQQLSGFARIYVTGGDGTPTEIGSQPRILVFIEDRAPPNPDDVLEIGLHDESYHAPFGGLKTANYWFNADALAQARRRKFDETLLFNDRAELVSACMANVFLLIGDQLHTPSRATGARSGVIREWVMKRSNVRERRLRREDVLAADEIFLTNSWIGIQSVATVEGGPLGPRNAGPRLAAALDRRREEIQTV
jgi:branched-subunit amino acid aminotransferase/4-amino-4-deoxychorismate lyase